MTKNTIFFFLCILFTTLCCAQDTYVKSFKSFDDPFEFANTILLNDELVYISSRGNCDSNGCAISMMLNNQGDVLWKNKHSFTYGGNSNSIVLNADTLSLASYEPWKYLTYNFHLIFIDKENGNTLSNHYYNYDTLSMNGVNSQGVLKFENQFLIYGEYRDLNGVASGLIQWTNSQGVPIRTTTYQLTGNRSVNALQDLQPDGYGNLVFVTVFRDSLFNHNSVIRKLSYKGEVIKEINIPGNEALNPRPQLAVNNQGQFVFSHAKWGPGTIKQLVCVDTSGNILWTHNFPLKIEGQQPQNLSNNYHITQITPTRDGGVVITARIRTNRIQNRFYDDAYIGKFDKIGTLEWERRINIRNDVDTLYDWCSLYDIKERPDGMGYVAVGSHTPSENLSTTNILLVSLDLDGCIEGMPCDGDHVVVSALDVIDLTDDRKKVSLFPNPFFDQLHIECEESVYIRITDIAGRIMMEQNIQPGNTNVETLTWSPGMYIVNFQSKNGSNESYKVIRQ